MPLETLDDIVESIADQVGAYGCGPLDGSDHPENCPCRICFTGNLHQRILAAAEVDAIMQNAKAKLHS